MTTKKALKKFFTYVSIALALAFSIILFYFVSPQGLDSIDNRLRDYFFTLRGDIPNSDSVIIIDIDEKSLKEIGQWPWSRNKVAKILENLTNSGVGLIAFDIVFPEEDNSSPHKIFKEYGIEKDNIPNYDLELAKMVSNTPTILGYQFELEKKDVHLGNESPQIPAVIIERDKKLGQNYLIKATGTILNLPIIQNTGYSSGFFNNVPDLSGIIRSVPLVISYEDIVYPSLALEILRIITDSKKIVINYDEAGVIDISLNQIKIPTDRHGRFLVNYRGAEKNFKYFSAVDILNNKIDSKELEGKIALIGTSAAGLLDLRATPLDFVFPGVEVHANVIDNIITGDFISKESSADLNNVTIIIALSLLIILLITYSPFWFNPIISLSSMIGISIFLYHMLFTYGMVLNIFFPLFTILLATILATLINYFYKIKQEEAIKEKFASKVSKDVMENLLKNMDSNEFQAMEKEVTVFFSDIRGFTKISEEMDSAKNLISYLNQYMEPMSNIITKYQGTIDKYIGDAIMAYWNAPANVENHADKAVQASLEQIKELKSLNKKLKEENKPSIDIGIGLNTGLAVVGEMGSSGRSDYTVIGDAINLGARIESLCKYYDSKLSISNFTKKALKDEYVFRFLDYVTVKGKDKPIEIWQVHKVGKAKKEQEEELKDYHKAIELYKISNFNEALEIFETIENSEYKTNKNIYKIYIERCKEFIKYPPKNFNGVYEHRTKS